MTTAADCLVETIQHWGVDTIFGLPGDGINGIMESLRVRADKIRFIQVRHEESAAFMATAYAKYTGRLGCCLATSGPGAIHLLNGLYDAKLDQAPVLALTGTTYHDLIGTHYQQDVDELALFQGVADYNQRIMGPSHVRAVADLACRTALNRKSVAHLTFPTDMQHWTMPGHPSEAKVLGASSQTFAFGAQLPAMGDLERAAAALDKGKRICILAGRGALGCQLELEALAEKLGAPIVKALLGKAAVPDESPYTTGGIGLLGTKPSEEAMQNCDTLLIVGSSFPYMSFYPRPGQAVGIQIDRNPVRIGLRYPVEVGLVGDSRETLKALLPVVRPHADKGFLQTAQRGMADWWKLMDARSSFDVTPMHPEVVARAVSEVAADDAILSTDSGTVTTWIARHFKIRRGQSFSLAGNLATMACGLPYSIAAKLAHPDRQSIAFVGDGAFTMLMGDFATAVKYNLPIICVVIKNCVLGQIMWEQMVFLGNPQYGVDLWPINFAEFARACGGVGITVDDPKKVKSALVDAISSGKPAVVECVTNPYEPPMPAEVSSEQALHMAEALARGEPNRVRIAETIFRDRIHDLTKG
ncbi:MAG TPA: thiamine pyrophosphate-dependent enzyme [Chloroflexota bacterium]|nr:thiamine pyrophosphate-dependent enzyme [Chloroflexota bacterium]